MIFKYFNTQTLALLAVVAGFVVLCLGMWYLWTMQQQLRTEVQLLRSSNPITNTFSNPLLNAVPPTVCKETKTSQNYVTMPASINTEQLETVAQRNNGSSLQDHQDHQDHQDQTNNTEESDESDYEDDDEDITDEDDDDNAESCTSNVVAASNSNQSVDLVESLLSSMVTSTIDGSIDIQGGATVVMSCVDVDGVNTNTYIATDENDQSVDHVAGPEIEDCTDQEEAIQEDVEYEQTEEEDAETVEISADPAALADELRQKTVAELKLMCQDYNVGVRRTGGTFKRKEELVNDLVDVVCTTDHETDESTNTAET